MNLHLLDGSAYIHRAYHAWPKLTRKSDGHPTGAVLGFCEFLWSAVRRPVAERTHLAVVMDGGHSGRNKLYPEYKAHRGKKDDDLVCQWPLVERACEAFGVKTVRVADYEADDVIATLATVASAAGGKTIIHSGDKDLMQLVDERVSMFDPMKKEHIGPQQVMDKWGVTPEQVVHIQALLGDAVDGIPGVPKVGVKTAMALIQKYHHIEVVIDAAARQIIQGTSPLQRNNLVTFAADARLSLQLATLLRDVPGTPPLDELETVVRDYRPVFDFCEEMEFEDLLSRIEQQAA